MQEPLALTRLKNLTPARKAVNCFRYGVAFIVAYIGVQLILSTFRYVPEWSTCAVSMLVSRPCLLSGCFMDPKSDSAAVPQADVREVVLACLLAAILQPTGYRNMPNSGLTVLL